MTTRFAKAKKFAGFAVMASALAAAGLGLGSGTAQADTTNLCMQPQMTICNTIRLHNQIADNFFDHVQGVFRVGEGTPFDRAVDRFFGVK
jgi:hypothetical protein